jgi:predicted regulator of Ras-like GTPase activity (Roadblock/LC7/MglB family)
MVTRESELLSVLGALKDDLGDPQWVALVDDRGLVMACVPENPQIDIERVAAMVAALTISGERVINEIAGGHLRYVNVSGSKRQQLIIFLNLECVLTLGLDPYVSPRSTFKALARWAPKIMQILQMSFSGD